MVAPIAFTVVFVTHATKDNGTRTTSCHAGQHCVVEHEASTNAWALSCY